MAEEKGPGMLAVESSILRTKDLELFESGFLADVEVKCGGQTWKLHKTILCTRSVWFNKALTGVFKESETGVVALQEQERCDIDCFLKFIYTGSIDLQKSYPGDDALVALLRVWKTADYLVHAPLRDLAVRGTSSHAREHAQSLCTAFPGENHVEDTEKIIESSLNPAISLLYSEEMGSLKKTFLPIYMSMAIASVHGLSNSKAFGSLLRDCPEFAADWATELMRGFRQLKPVSPGRAAGRCNQCGEMMGGKGTVDTLKWVRDEYLMVVCDQCYKVPALEEWQSKRK
ncbi:hypothetical protein KVR01_012505 [Diaporthe batatas]|uniref:uncharacterized protein n=1 Tax=Diaporthe batatas TaxID=748121 RepID=UPI001D04AB73|nr:uncharacterized protein KVR01_012505 [Diaporthe batatas]KAG8157843.1 hypothetical protein KVR01_012505 [Diaporthe batatas]